MASGITRQRYGLATGKGLVAPPAKSNPEPANSTSLKAAHLNFKATPKAKLPHSPAQRAPGFKKFTP